MQKVAYTQEAEIYNDFDIQPLTQKMDSLLMEWQNGIILKAVTDGQIIGSVVLRGLIIFAKSES